MTAHTRSLVPLLRDIRACTLCAPHLPQPPRPVLQAHRAARILIAGQAPGRKVDQSGIPFDDASGDRLRLWMGIDKETPRNNIWLRRNPWFDEEVIPALRERVRQLLVAPGAAAP